MGQARINRSNKPKPEANRSAKDATENHQRPRRFAWNPRVILAFDIITQEFREVPFPDEGYPNSVVGSLNGRLCVFNTSYDLRDDIWVMNEHGVASSWTTIRISLLYRLMKPVCSTKNSEEVLLALDKYMVLYNFETHAWRTLELHGVDLTQGFDVNTYVESLVSPNSYGLDNRRKHFDFKLI
ncbi:unnamed protein product [Brassica rapa subsp. trilocularis]